MIESHFSKEAVLATSVAVSTSLIVYFRFFSFLNFRRNVNAVSLIGSVFYFFVFLQMVNDDFKFVVLLPFAILSLIITGVDLATHRIPNIINMILACSLTTLTLIIKFFVSEWAAVSIIASGVVLFISYCALNLVSGNRIGMGDVKLAYSVGIVSGVFGFTGVTMATLSAIIFAGLYATFLLVTRRASFGTEFAFGPFMILGAWISLWIGVSNPVFLGY